MTQNTGIKCIPFWKREKVKLLSNHVCVTLELTTAEQSRLDPTFLDRESKYNLPTSGISVAQKLH